jgi:AraC family transcriptional regulator
MRLAYAPASPAGPTHVDARCGLPYPNRFVTDEPEWRVRPCGSAPDSSRPRVIATRWHALSNGTREVSAQTANDCHVIAIILRNTDSRFVVSGRTVVDGVATPGMVHVTEPRAPARCVVRGPHDTLHLYVPNALIAECARDTTGGPAAVLPSRPVLIPDPLVDRLGRALLAVEQVSVAFGPLYVDCVSVAIVARLLTLGDWTAARRRSRVTALANWRLTRAFDYIETHLAESVSLGDVASAAGLSRMRFAAQFKAATGLRPHEYLLRRRIERAQQMLAGGESPLIEIALSVGFQSQSHFTSVFKHFVGLPPRAWRVSQV